MAKSPGKCIFCGKGGLTKEHMWADWLRAYIPRDMTQHRTQSVLLFPDRAEESFERRTGDPHSRRIKCVCRNCNNGWMGKLQEKTKPFLVPMLEGKDVSFYRNGQTALAAWVAMFVMVAEFIYPDKTAISAQERTWFMNNQRAPSHWRVWIGRYARSTTIDRFFHHVVPFVEHESEIATDDSMPPPPNAQTSTILLGEYLVIHVMSSAFARRIIRRWPLLPHIAPMMCEIWPVQNRIAAWPPPGILSETDVGAMANQFFDRVDRVVRRREGLE